MPIYRLNFIYQLADQGWTETYYRFADSARLASHFGDPQHLQHWMDCRPHAAKLMAIRAQGVDGLRRVYLRELGLQGLFDDPDVTCTAAVLQLDFAGTAGRHLWLRGLADSLVKRRFNGSDNPQPRLIQALSNLSRSIKELALRGRQIVNRHPWSHAFLFGPDENPQLTRVLIRENFAAVPGDYVYFGLGPVLGIRPERAYLVVDREPTELILANAWPENLGFQVPDKPVRVRKHEFDYPFLDGAEFKFFRKHSTGAAYRPVSWVADGLGRMPQHPCGRLVDRLRTCYATEMRPFRHDIAITVPVKWYFLEEGKPAVPYEHPFASRNWELQTDYPTLLGEVFERTHYSGRAPVELNGVGLCGSRDAWENGASPDETIKPINPTTGQPCCCGPGVLQISGGAAAGTRPPAVVVQGGAAAGGNVADFSGLLVNCDVMANWKFRVIMPPATNSACTDCANLGGTWECTRDPAITEWCEWVSDDSFTVCGTPNNRWVVRAFHPTLGGQVFMKREFGAGGPTFQGPASWNPLFRTEFPIHPMSDEVLCFGASSCIVEPIIPI